MQLLQGYKLILSSSRFTSRYVERVKLLDYWKLHDSALSGEFVRSRLLVMVDRKPLVRVKDGQVTLIATPYIELKKRLGDYGLHFSLNNSVLIDAIEGEEPNSNFIPLFGTAIMTEAPPEDIPIKQDDILRELARTLGGRFMDVRRAMLTMEEESQRNILAKFQSIVRWAKTYRRCPKCAIVLKMRASKSAAECTQCGKVYYPTFSPVAITLITNESSSHALLVRHRGSANGVYTCVAGFAHSGESLSECARREIAEEVGILANDVRQLGYSQPWPMPDSSLMCAHHAIADMNDTIAVCPEELETAQWFSKEEVKKALERTIKDPFLKGLPTDIEQRQKLFYVPPRGAIAHKIIQEWVEGKI